MSRSVEDTGLAPGTFEARITYTNTGDVQTFGDPSPAVSDAEWLRVKGAGAGGDWEIRADQVSGSAVNTGDSLATWLSLGTTRFWGFNTSASVVLDSVIDVSIRRAGSSVVADVARITLRAGGIV